MKKQDRRGIERQIVKRWKMTRNDLDRWQQWIDMVDWRIRW